MVRPQIDLCSTDQRRVEQFAEEQGLRMSRAYAELLLFALDERVGSSEDELQAAYRDNRETAREVNEEWEHVSTEANQYLDEPPLSTEEWGATWGSPAHMVRRLVDRLRNGTQSHRNGHSPTDEDSK